jgi:hypothetical protein
MRTNHECSGVGTAVRAADLAFVAIATVLFFRTHFNTQLTLRSAFLSLSRFEPAYCPVSARSRGLFDRPSVQSQFETLCHYGER